MRRIDVRSPPLPPPMVHTRSGRLVSYAGGETSLGGAYGAKARRRLGSSSVGGSSIPVSIVSRMQNPLTPPGPEGDYRRLGRRKETRSKSTHLVPPMVADLQVAPIPGGDPLLAGWIVPQVRAGPMRRARPD